MYSGYGVGLGGTGYTYGHHGLPHAPSTTWTPSHVAGNFAGGAAAPSAAAGPSTTPAPSVPLPDLNKEIANTKTQLSKRQLFLPDFATQWKKHATIPNAHKDAVRSLDWSVDGAWLATSGDDTIKLWAPSRSTDARSARVLAGHTQKVNMISWDPTNPFVLASSGSDRTVRLWDIRTGETTTGSGSGACETKPVSTLSVPTTILNMAYHPDGQYLAVSDHDDRVSLVDARQPAHVVGLVRDRKSSKDEEVNEISWTPDGRQFVLAKNKGAIEVLDARSGAVAPTSTEGAEAPLLHWPRTHLVRGHTSNLFAMACDPTNRFAVSGGADSVLALWNTADWTSAGAYQELREMVRSVAFSFDGEYIASLGEQSLITILASETMQAVHPLAFTAGSGSLAWHPSRYTLAYAASKTPAVVNVAGSL